MNIIEKEKRNRINVALWAYAYEIMNDPIVSDKEYDDISLQINPQISTNNPIMDNFFKKEFSIDTGMWIYNHPDLAGLTRIYSRLKGRLGTIPKSSINTKIPITSQTQAAINAGFKTYTEVKLYLASLGFCMVDDYQFINGNCYQFQYDKESLHVIDIKTKESKSLFYDDILKCKK